MKLLFDWRDTEIFVSGENKFYSVLKSISRSKNGGVEIWISIGYSTLLEAVVINDYSYDGVIYYLPDAPKTFKSVSEAKNYINNELFKLGWKFIPEQLKPLL